MFTLAFEHRKDVTSSQNRGISGPTKMTCPKKFLKTAFKQNLFEYDELCHLHEIIINRISWERLPVFLFLHNQTTLLLLHKDIASNTKDRANQVWMSSVSHYCRNSQSRVIFHMITHPSIRSISRPAAETVVEQTHSAGCWLILVWFKYITVCGTYIKQDILVPSDIIFPVEIGIHSFDKISMADLHPD